MPFPALKMGPGDSARSHTADEFIFLSEIEEGVKLYVNILKQLFDTPDQRPVNQSPVNQSPNFKATV